MTDPLDRYWAKSPAHPGAVGERLTAHLAQTALAAARFVARVGAPPVVTDGDDWRDQVVTAALLHDAGKVAVGFQLQVSNPAFGHLAARIGTNIGGVWGQRHEILSLAFVDLLLGSDDPRRLPVATAVAAHHRPLLAPSALSVTGRDIRYSYPTPAATVERLTGQVVSDDATALARWFTDTARQHGISGFAILLDGPVTDWAMRAARLLHEVLVAAECGGTDGLTIALSQGAVVAADHLSSAHVQLDDRLPLRPDSVARRLAAAGRAPRPHQKAAWSVRGHLDLHAPTGSGKTEAALGWAAAQVLDLPGQPRVVWTLPYLAPLDAMRHRLAADLDVRPEDVHAIHSRSPERLLADALTCGDDPAQAARKALARDNAARLFTGRLRVATPYQVLFGMLAGPARSPALTDAANSVIVFDELHAYEPVRLGWLLAAMRIWERLGTRIGIASATTARRLRDLVAATVTQPVTRVDAQPAGLRATRRHRWHVDDRDLTHPDVLASIAARTRHGPVLVVLNTIVRANAVAHHLRELGVETTLLHSRFTAHDRARIERRLRERFATHGVMQSAGAIVTTQVVEVSLDIDMAAAWTDLATLDALVQRAGRVNRAARSEPSDFTVCIPRDDMGAVAVPAFYPEGNVAQTLTLCKELAELGVPDETHIVDAIDCLYDSAWGDTWADHVTSSRDDFTRWCLDLTRPHVDRTALAEQFEARFDGGVEAVPEACLDRYLSDLTAGGPGRAGRLVAGRWLCPAPAWMAAATSDARPLITYDETIRANVAHAHYEPEGGLDPSLPTTADATLTDTIL